MATGWRVINAVGNPIGSDMNALAGEPVTTPTSGSIPEALWILDPGRKAACGFAYFRQPSTRSVVEITYDEADVIDEVDGRDEVKQGGPPSYTPKTYRARRISAGTVTAVLTEAEIAEYAAGREP